MKNFVRMCIILSLVVCILAGMTACQKQDDTGLENIIFTYYVNSTIARDLREVEAAINEITEASIQVHVTLQPISLGTYNEQINLMLTSQEPMDVFAMSGTRFSSYVSNQQCIPLDDLLSEHGQGILETVGREFLKGGSIDGVTYGVMPLRDIAQGVGFYIRKDYVEKYGIDLSKVHTMQDVEPILAAIKAAEPDLYPLVVENNVTLSPVEMCAGKDNVGDGYGVLPNSGNGTTIVNYYATPEYRQSVETMHRWFQAGYISPDSTTSTENIATQMKADKGVCYFYKTKTGMDNQESKANNHEMVHADIVMPYISTMNAQLLTYGIAQQSEHPEAAMKFLNLLYSNPEVLNLLDWGIEGKHYVRTADGHITYPDGVDSTNSGYNMNMTWAFGNSFESYIWEGNDITIWDQARNALANSQISPTMGFTFDNSNVKTELAALENVAGEYRMGLESGSMDPAKLDDFLSALEKAGVNQVIQEKQNQLDAWLKTGK